MKLAIFAILFFAVPQLYAQTCCTAGASISNAYGIPDAVDKTWAFNIAYEYNGINLLIDQNERLVNDPRTRFAQRLSAKVDYVLNRKWSFSAVLPMIHQSRTTISASEKSLGAGDLLLLSQFRLYLKEDYALGISAGLKIPLGQRDHRSDAAILLSPDMQSGSGSWDWVARASFAKEHFLLPFLTSSLEVSFRDNGINPSFGSTPQFSGRRFGFGDEWVSIFSISYQWTTTSGFLIPDVKLKFRRSNRNIEQEVTAPNSGGSWLSIPFGLSFQPNKQLAIRLYAELPIYQELNGLQITTSFSTGLQLRYALKKKVKQSTPLNF